MSFNIDEKFAALPLVLPEKLQSVADTLRILISNPLNEVINFRWGGEAQLFLDSSRLLGLFVPEMRVRLCES